MHSTLTRAQAVFGFFTTVALFVAGAAALSVLFMSNDAAGAGGEVEVRNVQVVKGRPHYYSSKKEEFAGVRFYLDADLSPLFNWNTKQLFVYVFATYSSSNSNNPSIRPSESIIWDTIIPAPESPYSFSALRAKYFPGTIKKPKRGLSKKKSSSDSNANNKNEETPGVLHLRNQRPKYQIGDITGKMAERENVSLAVGWNVQPWVGALWWSPGSGTVPRTLGSAGRSEGVDFPALKGSKPQGQGQGQVV